MASMEQVQMMEANFQAVFQNKNGNKTQNYWQTLSTLSPYTTEYLVKGPDVYKDVCKPVEG